MPSCLNPWDDLFAAGPGRDADARVELRLLRRQGRPLLLLPGHARSAAATLSLYPAQTSRGRAVRTLWRWLARFSIPFGAEKTRLTVSPDDPFVRFLASLAGHAAGGMPEFGILAGNPASEGQRFLVAVFDANYAPMAVVKVGATDRARALIGQEASFLTAVPERIQGILTLRGTFQSQRLKALAMYFIEGDSPQARHEAAIPGVLGAWVDAKRRIPLGDTADWLRLERAISGADRIWAGVAHLRERSVCPVIQHGDFAPWNIKVSRQGIWTVLDWERGELAGIPGWDWFHYLIQTGILVEHQPVASLAQRVEDLLKSGQFRRYAAASGITGCERDLALAYLLHCVAVIKPSEGLAEARELLNALAARWRKA